MHIYHYAAYETMALKRLAGFYGTREEELDTLLRGHVFVDLYRVVLESVFVSRESYSIQGSRGPLPPWLPRGRRQDGGGEHCGLPRVEDDQGGGCSRADPQL